MSGTTSKRLLAKVLSAVKYTDQFNFPLTTYEVWLRLPGFGRMSAEKVAAALADLFRLGLVERDSGYWKVTEGLARAETRKNHLRNTIAKRGELKALLQFFNFLPSVKGVAITGSVSMNNAAADDDIDFMIVTSENRLWLVRPVVILFAWLQGKRRSWHREEKNSWCFNLWLDNKSMQMPKKQRNIYTAYEVCQAEWVISKDKTAEKFFKANNWSSKLLPNYFEEKLSESVPNHTQLDIPNPLSFIFDFLNEAAFKLQLWYMRSHRTTERVGRGHAFFHPRDTYTQIKKSLGV